jgi:hypothetical protein
MHLTLTLVFFVPYVLCEVPSNLLLAKFNKASWYMGTLVVSWGIVSVYGLVLLIDI